MKANANTKNLIKISENAEVKNDGNKKQDSSVNQFKCFSEIEDLYDLLDSATVELDSYTDSMEKQSKYLWMLFVLEKLIIHISQLEHFTTSPLDENSYEKIFNVLYQLQMLSVNSKIIDNLIAKFEQMGGVPKKFVLRLKANLLYKQEDFLQAANIYEQLVKIETEKSDIISSYERIGRCYYYQYEKEKKQLSEDMPPNKAEEEHLKDLLEKSSDAFRRVISEEPKPSVLEMLVMDSLYLEKYDDIFQLCKQIIDVANPLDEAEVGYLVEARRILANFYASNNQFENAIEQFKAIVNTTTSDPELLKEFKDILVKAKESNAGSIDKNWADRVIHSIESKLE